jgi:hypothetical protein
MFRFDWLISNDIAGTVAAITEDELGIESASISDNILG